MTDNPSQLNNEWMQFVTGDEPWPKLERLLPTYEEVDGLRAEVERLERRVGALEEYVRELTRNDFR